MKFTLTNESVSVIDNGQTHTVAKSAVNFAALRAALLAEDFAKARGYLTLKSSVEAWAKGSFKLVNGRIRSGDEDLPESLSGRIFDMIRKGDDPQSLLNFWDKLGTNPSWRSVQQVWGFLANKGIPLDQDGNILAYKAVNSNWKDCHSNSIDNSVGTVHEMPRNKISDDPNQACHYGFHVGALEYAQGFGPSDRKMIICKVNPADVVCVPYDASQQKMRVCKYEVIGVQGARMDSTTVDTRKDPAVKAVKKEVAKTKKVEAKVQKATAKAVKAGKEPAAPKAAPAKGTHPFDDFNSFQLLEQILPDLRTYAAIHLKIIGASKIPGGKVALIARIEEVRG